MHNVLRNRLTCDDVQGKNFGNACKDCYTEKRLNEGLEGVYTNVICTCDGIANIVHDLGKSPVIFSLVFSPSANETRQVPTLTSEMWMAF